MPLGNLSQIAFPNMWLLAQTPSKRLGIIRPVAWSFFAYGRSISSAYSVYKNYQSTILKIICWIMCFLKKNGNILYQEDSTGCAISSFVQDSNKTKWVLVKQIFTVKSKTSVFSNEANYQSNSLSEVINEFKLVDLVFVMFIIVHTGDINTTRNNLTLKEYIATDDIKSKMKIEIFEQFADQTELNNTYKI